MNHFCFYFILKTLSKVYPEKYFTELLSVFINWPQFQENPCKKFSFYVHSNHKIKIPLHLNNWLFILVTLCFIFWKKIVPIFVKILYPTWHSPGLLNPVSSIIILSSRRLQYSLRNTEHSWTKKYFNATQKIFKHSTENISPVLTGETWWRALRTYGVAPPCWCYH